MTRTVSERPTPHVLVIGGGIGGTMAALAAARAGVRVSLACAGALFSGSSFYQGTWGLGLVGPEDEADEEELAQTILDLGGGAADPALVRSFVAGIRPAIDYLEGLGVKLQHPARAGEREFIPCFDHKHRLWRGITRTTYEEAVGAALAEAGAEVLPHRELMDLVEQNGRVAGAVLFDRERKDFEKLRASAVVLATGGYGGLFERRLTAADVIGSAQAIAVEHGCELVNLEFMQIMPAFIKPRSAYGVVFNEKVWRYTDLVADDGSDALEPWASDEGLTVQEVLELRSGHGPFSARTASRAVDRAIDAAGPEGVRVRYRNLAGAQENGADDAGAAHELPEFVRTYFSWLESDRGVRPDDELRIAEFAHAANGGIRINEDGATDLAGLYACGECTGGMHGADRLGGLASANALVFGLRAGRAAALLAPKRDEATGAGSSNVCARYFSDTCGSTDAAGVVRELQAIMSAHCMVCRSEKGLAEAEARIGELAERLRTSSQRGAAPAAVAATRRAQLQLALARAIVAAERARTQSCGSHYRTDA